MKRSIWIGWDPREASAFAVARHSIRQHLSRDIEINGLVLHDLQAGGYYTRPMARNAAGLLVDTLSAREDYDGAIATEHANARFLVPEVAGNGWAMFCDGDVLFRDDVHELFDGLDPRFAVYCVKHDYRPAEGVKMDGQKQVNYARKNWSSCMVFNVGHPANRALTLEMINSVPGRDLHAFSWLDDSLIGELDPKWNWLVGHSSPSIDPAMVHFTTGVPDMPGYHDVPYADEWRNELMDWAAADL